MKTTPLGSSPPFQPLSTDKTLQGPDPKKVSFGDTMLQAINREAVRRMLTTPNVVRLLLSEQLTRPSDVAPQGGEPNASTTT